MLAHSALAQEQNVELEWWTESLMFQMDRLKDKDKDESYACWDEIQGANFTPGAPATSTIIILSNPFYLTPSILT